VNVVATNGSQIVTDIKKGIKTTYHYTRGKDGGWDRTTLESVITSPQKRLIETFTDLSLEKLK